MKTDGESFFGTIAANYCNLQGTWTWDGFGNIAANPGFVDPSNGDYRLSPGSACIDAGLNNYLPTDAADLDGDGITAELTPLDLDGLPRIVDDPSTDDTGCGFPFVVDMGAYEFQGGGETAQPIYGDLNEDDIVNGADLGTLLASWGTTGCDIADLNGDGTVNGSDLGILLGAWTG